jgi:hypothetical protein
VTISPPKRVNAGRRSGDRADRCWANARVLIGSYARNRPGTYKITSYRRTPGARFQLTYAVFENGIVLDLSDEEDGFGRRASSAAAWLPSEEAGDSAVVVARGRVGHCPQTRGVSRLVLGQTERGSGAHVRA